MFPDFTRERLLDADLQSVLKAAEDFDFNRLPFMLEALDFLGKYVGQ